MMDPQNPVDCPAAPLDAPLSTEERLVADLALITGQRNRAVLERDALHVELANVRAELLAARTRIAELGRLAEGMAQEAAGELQARELRIRTLEVAVGWRRGRVARFWAWLTRRGPL
jgi:hypothetical protein